MDPYIKRLIKNIIINNHNFFKSFSFNDQRYVKLNYFQNDMEFFENIDNDYVKILTKNKFDDDEYDSLKHNFLALYLLYHSTKNIDYLIESSNLGYLPAIYEYGIQTNDIELIKKAANGDYYFAKLYLGKINEDICLLISAMDQQNNYVLNKGEFVTEILGDFYYDEHKYSNALLYYKKCVYKSNEDAQNNYIKRGKIYYHHIKNLKKAFKYFELSQNYEYLGLMYYNGEYVEKNYEKAYDHLIKDNSENSYFLLGKMYLKGKYVKIDEIKAEEYFRKSQNKSKKYLYLLANKYFKEKNYTKSHELLILSKSNENLALMYLYGYGIRKNLITSLEYFEKIENKKKYLLDLIKSSYSDGFLKEFSESIEECDIKSFVKIFSNKIFRITDHISVINDKYNNEWNIYEIDNDKLYIMNEEGIKYNLHEINNKDAPIEFENKYYIALNKNNDNLYCEISKKNFTENICSICLDPIYSLLLNVKNSYYFENDVLITKCKHRFHKYCIEQWKIKNKTCPMCREII